MLDVGEVGYVNPLIVEIEAQEALTFDKLIVPFWTKHAPLVLFWSLRM